MKSLLVVATVFLVGCASTRPINRPVNTAISMEQLDKIEFTLDDCRYINHRINYIEDQLNRRGLLSADPEKLNEDDRVYNGTARILIWNLRIGCANPTRFAKQ